MKIAINLVKVCKCFIRIYVGEGEVRDCGFKLPIYPSVLTVICKVPQSYDLSIDILICTRTSLLSYRLQQVKKLKLAAEIA